MQKNKSILDNSGIENILNILENMEDEVMSAQLLKEFNDKSAHLGKLLLNNDKSLSNEQWKADCDKAKEDLDKVINDINQRSS